MFVRVMLVFISLLFIESCTNSEKEARAVFNQAIIEWNSGNIEEAERKFDIIEDIYLDTVTATESMKERALLKKNYKSEYDIEKSKRKNRGIFSRTIYLKINKYYKENSRYPDNLAELNIPKDDKYLSLCEYKKSLFEYGYQLDCIKADEALRNDRKKIKSANAKRIKNRNQLKKLNDFPKANSTWAEKFNPSKNVPEKGFYAYYINTNNPSQVIKKETVGDVSINYVWDKFHSIKSKDFGGYWVGRINLVKDEVKSIAINQSWSKTRLIVDGFIVYEGGSNQEILLDLEKGSHLIEVEYINNWHTTEFSLSFMNKVEKLSLSDIKSQLAENILGEYDIYYAALYESSSKDLSTVLNIGKTPKSVVLFLSSYSPVKWHISNPYMTNIRAIIYGSFSPGAKVVGDLDKSTLLLPSKKRIGSYSSEPKCSCNSGHFHCEGSSMLSTKNTLEKLSQQKLVGFSGKYSASSLKVPEIIINEKYIEDQKLNNENIKLLRNSCKKQNDPDFEKIFEN